MGINNRPEGYRTYYRQKTGNIITEEEGNCGKIMKSEKYKEPSVVTLPVKEAYMKKYGDVFPAHIKIKNGEIIVQSNRDHLMNTAKYCSESLRTIGLQKCGYMAGLGHDLGKWTKSWKNYIERIVLEELNGERAEKHGTAIHTFQGVKYILDTFHSGAKNRYRIITAELIAYAIGAHHGQFDCINPGSGRGENGFDHRRNADDEKTGYEEAKRNFGSEFGRDFISRLFDECVEEVRVLFY